MAAATFLKSCPVNNVTLPQGQLGNMKITFTLCGTGVANVIAYKLALIRMHRQRARFAMDGQLSSARQG